MKLAEVIIGLLFLAACAIALLVIATSGGLTDRDATTELLRKNGYKNITITGWRPLMAGEDDTFSTGFEATTPTGERVSGAVTSGWLKGSTIRFD